MTEVQGRMQVGSKHRASPPLSSALLPPPSSSLLSFSLQHRISFVSIGSYQMRGRKIMERWLRMAEIYIRTNVAAQFSSLLSYHAPLLSFLSLSPPPPACMRRQMGIMQCKEYRHETSTDWLKHSVQPCTSPPSPSPAPSLSPPLLHSCRSSTSSPLLRSLYNIQPMMDYSIWQRICLIVRFTVAVIVLCCTMPVSAQNLASENSYMRLCSHAL